MLTIDLMTRDGLAIAEYAAKCLGQKKVILMGGSWGSALGVHMALRRPDLFHAHVGTAQLVSERANMATFFMQKSRRWRVPMLGAQRAHKVFSRNGATSVAIRKSRSPFLMNCIPGVLVSMPNSLPMRLVSPRMDELHLTPLVLIDRIAALVPLPRTHWHQPRSFSLVCWHRTHRAGLW